MSVESTREQTSATCLLFASHFEHALCSSRTGSGSLHRSLENAHKTVASERQREESEIRLERVDNVN